NLAPHASGQGTVTGARGCKLMGWGGVGRPEPTVERMATQFDLRTMPTEPRATRAPTRRGPWQSSAEIARRRAGTAERSAGGDIQKVAGHIGDLRLPKTAR